MPEAPHIGAVLTQPVAPQVPVVVIVGHVPPVPTSSRSSFVSQLKSKSTAAARPLLDVEKNPPWLGRARASPSQQSGMALGAERHAPALAQLEPAGRVLGVEQACCVSGPVVGDAEAELGVNVSPSQSA
jgi:hypothetical protein